MFFGSVPIFIGGGEGLRVEQRGPVRGAQKTLSECFLKVLKKVEKSFEQLGTYI
jgi:hypothetical protein